MQSPRASGRNTRSRMRVDTQSTQRSFATQTEYDSETENEIPVQILTKATDIATETKNKKHHYPGPSSSEFGEFSMFIYIKQENEGYNMTEDYNVQGEPAVQENFDSAIEMVNDVLTGHEIVSNEGSSNSLVEGSVHKSSNIEPFEEHYAGSSNSLVESSANKSIKIEPFEEPNAGSSNSLVEGSENFTIKIELLEEPNEDSSNSLVESSVNKSIKVEPLEEPSSDQYFSEKFLSSQTKRQTKASTIGKMKKKRRRKKGTRRAREEDRDKKRMQRLLKRSIINP